MKSALSHLLAARRCEIDELERLAHTSELVGVIGRFIHALQRERGMSNIFLASRGERFAAMRLEQIPECDALQAVVVASFDRLALDAGAVRNGARVFNRIAIALDALDGLPQLRTRIAARAISARDATAVLVRLIASLLGVVFEAVDSAGDAEISRALVAMFHFMQGKEYAGQERAHGAAVFAVGRIDAPGHERWRLLIDQQQHCLDVFQEFADPKVTAAELASCDHRTLVQIERMRRIGQSLGGMPMDESLVDAWYECCTERLDAMRTVEDVLAGHLRVLCGRKVGEARDALRDEQSTLDSLHREAAGGPSGPPIGPQLERSVIDMVHEQALRLQEMHDELETARSALNERKLIERAKGILMAHRHISEEEAHRTLRQMAMNQKRRVADIAQALLAMAEVLPGR
ncbi:nitrate- and nitrite sensing domain-containing protein [Ramlibacter sp. PS4R-6]|uniref:nitrate- and nitrite sensing domain-containing protein n=1 Tax=Ramlibacter sp. PS4R-6 TaxID=3133438 RepID=UPI0030ADE42B